MKPLADRVIVRAAAAEEKTKSGIIIPDTAKEKPQRGEVVAVGEGKTADNGTLIKPHVKVGDRCSTASIGHRNHGRRQRLPHYAGVGHFAVL